MTRPRRPGTITGAFALLAVALAGCGGGSGQSAGDDENNGSIVVTGELGDGSLGARLQEQPGPDVGIILGTSDFAVGDNRVSFLIVNNEGQVVTAPTAKVYLGRKLVSRPIATADATLRKLDPHGDEAHPQTHEGPDTDALFVTRLTFPEPGRYWVVVDLPGEDIQGVGAFDVKKDFAAPSVGERAVASNNPTLADAPAAEITTARPPAKELLRSSIEDALAAKAPFVAVFATPAYCTSRTCGPTVEIVDEVRKRFSKTNARFIQVEVYEDNDPANGLNEFMTEWKLPTEPWIFVVDSTGVIRERFEGSASVEELEAAVRKVT